MVDPLIVFSLVAGILALGFAGEIFFKKTGISYFLFLILIGIVVGPVFGVFPREPLLPALGIFAELTLVMVLFYSGMDMKLREAVSGSGRSFLQVILYVFLSLFAIASFSHFALGWDWIEALIFGSIVGGVTATPIVVPLARSLNLGPKTTTFITLESIINSIFSIVLFFTLVGFYKTGSASLLTTVATIAANFSVGIVLGILLSFLWLLLLRQFKGYKYTYVFTLALLFASYSITQFAGGSGLLAVLIFGLFLSNHKNIESIFRRRFGINLLQRQLKGFQSEISFLMETFFFVFLGLTFVISYSGLVYNLAIGLAFLAILLIFRTIATKISTRGSEMQKDLKPIVLLCAQGLTTATLAIVALTEGLPLANTFINLTVYVVILTSIVTTVGSVWVARKFKGKNVKK